VGDLRAYLLVTVMAAGLTYCLTPLVRAVAIRIRAVDRPGGRKMHAIATPTLGGLALFFGFIGGLALSSLLFPQLFVSSEAAGIAIGASLMVGIGIVDDLKGLSAPVKLAGQILAATTMTFGGVQVLFFWLPTFGPLHEGVISLAPELGIPITVLVVVVTVNAVNLVDGLDGLAAGIVAIAAAAFFFYSHQLITAGTIQPGSGPLFCAITVGICVGFLPHNFHPAKIFMGDAGALMLGLLMAASTMSVVGQTDQDFSGRTFFFFAPVLIPFLILGIPILDTAFAIVRRAGRRASISEADKSHLHHRLMRLGHGQTRSVLILWTWTALLSGLVLAPSYVKGGLSYVPFGIAGLAVVLYSLFGVRGRTPTEKADL
jgi:UDP-GlcNAc:undecaprenyl-phosphate/decaprenyl-phosphate GlcNAc-1-phosphate transferase